MKMEQLREQIAALLERKLSRAMRVGGVVIGVLLIVLSLAFIVPLRGRWDSLPRMSHLVVAVAVGCFVLLGVLLIVIARRGVFEVRRHAGMLVGVALLMSLGFGAGFLHHGWMFGDGQAVFGGAAMLVVGGVGFLMHVLEQYHLATKRKLLELELRMAELAEQISRLTPKR
jgi:hypothetical protein